MSNRLVKNLLSAPDGGLISRHGGQRWTPGEWVEVAGPLELCRRGLHANIGATDAEAFRRACGYVYPKAGPWRVEIGGEILRDTDKLCVRRMRIVEPLDRAELFRAAFPGSEPAWLDCVDDTIEMSRRIDWSACVGGRVAQDVVRAFSPWRRAAAAADAAAADAAAGRTARYHFARAVAPRDPRIRHPNPFAVLFRHYAEGGNWQDVVRAWGQQ